MNGEWKIAIKKFGKVNSPFTASGLFDIVERGATARSPR
jgi:hypothetical protein